MEGPCADSVEKREPASDLAIVVVDSLKRLTPTGRLEKRTHALQQFCLYSITSSTSLASLTAPLFEFLPVTDQRLIVELECRRLHLS